MIRAGEAGSKFGAAAMESYSGGNLLFLVPSIRNSKAAATMRGGQ